MDEVRSAYDEGFMNGVDYAVNEYVGIITARVSDVIPKELIETITDLIVDVAEIVQKGKE